MQSKEPVLITDAQLDRPGPRIVFVNHAFTAMTGYAEAEIVGQTPRILQGPRTDRDVLARLRRNLERGETFAGEAVNYRRDGSEFVLEWQVSPIRDERGVITHYLALQRDITDRRRAEEVLAGLSVRDTLRRKKAVAWELGIIALVCAAVFAIGHRFNLFLPSFRRLVFSRDGLKADADEVAATLACLVLAMVIFSCRRWWETRAEIFSQTQVSQALRVLQTETEALVARRTAQIELTNASLRREVAERQRAEAIIKQFPAIVESSDDAILSKTLGSVITSWNPAAEAMFGYTADEIIGQPVTRLFPPDRLEEENLILAEIVQGRRVRHFETVRVRKDGRHLSVSVTISPIKDAGGAIVGVSKIVRDITEQREGQVALKKSEEKFRMLVEQALDAFFLHDAAGRFIEVNRQACESLGYTRAELLALTVADISSVGADEARAIWARLQAGATLTVSDHHRRKDGTRFPVEVRLGSLSADGQEIVVGLARDVTERRRVEEQLLWKTAFFEAQVNSAPDGILIVDRTGKTILQNQRMIDLWQMPRAVSESPDDQARLDWVAGQIKGAPQFAERVAYLYAHPDEISRDEFELVDGRILDRYSAPVRGQDGRYYGRIWSFRDITEGKRAQEQIAEQAALLDKARDAILVRDLTGHILFWNQGAERMYGWTRAEVTGRNAGELLHSDPESSRQFHEATIAGGECSGEFRHRARDGRELTVEARWTLIRDGAGVPKSILVINTDITERKKIEAQFLRAQRMESIGTLAGGIAHDLNNILSPIMLSIAMLRDLAPQPLAQEMLNTIEASSRRGADIVRQVLSFARGIEGQRIEVQPKHLIEELRKIIKDTFPKDIRLNFEIPPRTWTIVGDPTQVHQVLLNLFVNARDAMPHGGTLTVGLENCVLDEQYAAAHLDAKPGRYVQIRVTDSGTGIPPGILDKIFEPFFTTKELNKGTGLGLSTVMAIVKSHGGLINVYSEPGVGTTFKIYLPAMDASEGAQQEQAYQASMPSGKGETILVVDDEVSILTITRQTLKTFGYVVLTATDGADALAVFVQHRGTIAIVLTDMMMPIMDGSALIHALLRIDPALKIVAASGLNANAGTARAAGSGVKHFLAKPYTASTLLKTIREVLDRI